MIEPEGIRFAWIYRLRWSEVTGARFRSRWGFRYLEISREHRRPWRLWLRMYAVLPAFLARYAPAGNPLELFGGENRSGGASG